MKITTFQCNSDFLFINFHRTGSRETDMKSSFVKLKNLSIVNIDKILRNKRNNVLALIVYEIECSKKIKFFSILPKNRYFLKIYLTFENRSIYANIVPR